MRNLAFSFSIFFLFFNSVNADTVRIGNAGEGFLSDKGDVYLLDLYERGSHHFPYVGESINARVQYLNNNTQFRQELSGFSNKLLLRKISDLEEYRKGLGGIILHILSRFSIRFTDEELPLVPNNTTTVDSKNRVQLAYRKHLKLDISRKYWENMDHFNRVALLIHEALFSLIKPVCAGRYCQQPSIFVRQIVGELFQQHPSSDLEVWINYFLILPQRNCGEEFMNIAISSFNESGDLIFEKDFSYNALSLYNKQVDKNIYEYCHRIKNSSNVKLNFSLLKYILPISQSFFATSYGTQSVFDIGELKKVEESTEISLVDGVNCFHEIQKKLSHFATKEKKLGMSAFPSCSLK